MTGTVSLRCEIHECRPWDDHCSWPVMCRQPLPPTPYPRFPSPPSLLLARGEAEAVTILVLCTYLSSTNAPANAIRL